MMQKPKIFRLSSLLEMLQYVFLPDMDLFEQLLLTANIEGKEPKDESVIQGMIIAIYKGQTEFANADQSNLWMSWKGYKLQSPNHILCMNL